jgi:threonine dehydratase
MNYSRHDLVEVHERILPYIHKTPVFSSGLINQLAGCEIYFKCENFQRMGAFKMRGATNAILQLSEEQLTHGVVTHSSGNFAQAVALASKTLGVKAYIVMPSNSPKVKIDAVRDYGGEIILCEPTLEAREATANEVIKKTGATFLHPYNQEEVFLGQGTACIELIQEVPDVEIVIAPVGGGGLLAGTAIACQHFAPNALIYGAEPANVDDAKRSFDSGKIEQNNTTNTIADGLRTTLGTLTFPIIKSLVKDILVVSEEEIMNALRLVMERMKIVIEPSSAVALAAILRYPELFKGKTVGLIVSGGNVELDKLSFK